MMLFSAEPVFKNMTIAMLDRIHRLWLRPKSGAHRSPRSMWSGCVSAHRMWTAHSARCPAAISRRSRLAKWLTHLPRVLVLSEPTRGMDVGAKDDVVAIVRGLREQGIGIVVVSTEPETVLSLADRILVMKKGSVVREFADEPVSKDRLLEAA